MTSNSLSVSLCLLNFSFRSVSLLTRIRHFFQIYSDKLCTAKGKSLLFYSSINKIPINALTNIISKRQIQLSFYMRRHVAVFTNLSGSIISALILRIHFSLPGLPEVVGSCIFEIFPRNSESYTVSFHRFR